VIVRAFALELYGMRMSYFQQKKKKKKKKLEITLFFFTNFQLFLVILSISQTRVGKTGT
jgi:hypothetical protein